MFPFCGVTCTDCQIELKCFLRYISLKDYEKFRGRNHVLYFSACPWLTWPRSCTHQICLQIVSINNWHVHRQWNRLTDCGVDIWSHMSIKGGNSDTPYGTSKTWRHCVSWDKPDIKGQILKTYTGNMNFLEQILEIYTTFLQWSNSWRQKVEWWLLGAGERRRWGGGFNRYKASVWEDEMFWRWMGVMVHNSVNPLNTTESYLKMAKMTKFMLCDFYHHA